MVAQRQDSKKSIMKIKHDKKLYSVRSSKCKKRKCFVPFSGNGQFICRLYELGQCPDEYKND